MTAAVGGRSRRLLGVAAALALAFFLLRPELARALGDVHLLLAALWLAPLGWLLGPWGGLGLGLAMVLPLALASYRGADLVALTLGAAAVTGAGGWLRRRTDLYRFRERALRLLGRVGLLAAQARSAGELLEGAAEAAVAEGGYLLAMIWDRVPGGFRPRVWRIADPRFAIEEEAGRLVIQRNGRPVLTLDLAALDWGKTAAGQALARQETVVTDARRMRGYAFGEAARVLGYRTAIAVPIADREEVVGALAVTHPEPSRFAREEAELVREVGALLGSALERLALRERLRSQAITDALTGLLNRRGFLEWGRVTLENAARRGRPMALLYLDLDRFKEVNDARGHEAGDRLLLAVAQRLARATRSRDLLARLGGDEFAALIEADREGAATVAKRIRQDLARPVALNGEEVRTGASIGIALFPDDAESLEELLRKGDLAMYRAKQEGLGFALFDPKDDRALRGRVALEHALRKALAEGGIRAYYQPVVDLEAGRLVYLEALARWQAPPSSFIPLAEEIGVIFELDLAMLENVVAQLVRWEADGRVLAAGVNLSPKTLNHEGLPALIEERLAHHDLAPARLVLEVTEAALLTPRGEAHLAELHRLGLRLAIDDFGTGCASLERLTDLPFDYLKIPRTFVREVAASPTRSAVVAGIGHLARHLGVRAIAEGVEGAGEEARLRELGLTLAQGFRYAAAMPPEEVPGWLARFPARLRNPS